MRHTASQLRLLKEYYSKDMLGQLHGLIQSNDRVIISADKEINFRKPVQEPNDKPEGLWYGVGPGWIEKITTDLQAMQGQYLHNIELDYSKIITLNNLNEIWDFTEEYGSADPAWPPGTDIGSSRPVIHWQMIKGYSGIEINPYLGNLRTPWDSPVRLTPELDWYRGWDVASGCVWHPSAIKSITLIADLDPKV